MAQGTGSGPGQPGAGRESQQGSNRSGQAMGQMREQAQHQAGKAAEQAQHQAGKATSQVQHQAGKVADQAREQGTSWASGQKEKLGQSMSTVAQTLRQCTSRLEQENQPGAARALEMTADQMEHLSSYVRQRDVNQLMSEMEHMARRRPEMFVGGAFVLGFLASRFLKSSSPEQDGTGAYSTSGYGAYPGAPTGYHGQARGDDFRYKSEDQPVTGTSGAQTPYRP